MHTVSPISGERVRTLRLATDISQTQLATTLDLGSNSVISKIENGRVPVDPVLATGLAEALGCTEDFLRRPVPDVIATRPWLRAYADASARKVEAVLADNLLVHEAVATIGLRRVAAPAVPHFDGDLNDGAAIEKFAGEVRAVLKLDEGDVVRNATRAAERLGIVVLPLSDEVGRHLGISQIVDGRPYIRVARPQPGVPGDRQRFTISHEVGHITLHGETSPPETAEDARRIENQAHRFAAAFLAPADALLEDLDRLGGRVTLTNLSELKKTWGIAIKALVVRLRHLGVIGDAQATSLYKQISKRGWNTGEPVPVSNERAVWLQQTLQRWAPDEVSPIEAAAAASGLDVRHIARWLAWDPESEADIVDLRTRQPSQDAGAGILRGDAIVKPLRRS